MAKNKLDQVFSRLKRKKKKALIAYLTAGYPSLNQQIPLIQKMEEAGVDVLELGIPFSDPIADGPTIQFSSQASLKSGTHLRGIIRWAGKLSQKVSMPLVVMSYINPILRYGLSAFAKDAARAGISGVIVPDMIPEEAKEIEKVLGRKKIHVIYLVAPTTPRARQKMIAKRTKGFLYAVSVAGVTGARKDYAPQTLKWLKGLGRMTSKPVCVGFGISRRDQILQLKKSVDGFIVGSALIDLIRRHSGSRRAGQISRFIDQLSKECFYGRQNKK